MRSLATFRGTSCLNCQTPLDQADAYCHQCGQLNTTKRLALKDFFSEFFTNFISYDSKLWRTITQLLTRPGFVTREYCAGKRSRYANPFRFFLTVSIVFFLIVQFGVQFADNAPITYTPGRNSNSLFTVTIDGDSTNRKEILADLKKSRDSSSKNRNAVETMLIDNAITELEKDSLGKITTSVYPTQKELDKKSYFTRYFIQIESYSTYASKQKEQLPEEALKNLEHRIDRTNVARYKKAKSLHELTGNPTEIINLVLPKIPLFLFFFAPVLSLFFWLIYARGTWNYMEHMVFNFHLFTFIFLILYLVILEQSLTNTSVIGTIFFSIIGPLYLYKAMRKFYQQKRFKTILKFLFINFVFFVLLTISSILFILGSIFVSV